MNKDLWFISHEINLIFLLHTADLKRTIAVLLDDILSRLVKLEGKIELVNTTFTNTSHPARGAIAPGPAAMLRAKRETPGGLPGTSRPHQHGPVRPH